MLFSKPQTIAMRALTKVEGRIVSENLGGGGDDLPMESRDDEQIGNDMANPLGSDFVGLENDHDDFDMAPGTF
jgi:hypothetical protein